MPDPLRRPDTQASTSEFGRYAGLGLQFVTSLALCGGVGWWLDAHFGISPWALVLGIVLGGVVGFVAIVRAVPPAHGAHVRTPKTSSPPRDERRDDES